MPSECIASCAFLARRLIHVIDNRVGSEIEAFTGHKDAVTGLAFRKDSYMVSHEAMTAMTLWRDLTFVLVTASFSPGLWIDRLSTGTSMRWVISRLYLVTKGTLFESAAVGTLPFKENISCVASHTCDVTAIFMIWI